jgi:hypothetical protein
MKAHKKALKREARRLKKLGIHTTIVEREEDLMLFAIEEQDDTKSISERDETAKHPTEEDGS